jgi:hypothetical protein
MLQGEKAEEGNAGRFFMTVDGKNSAFFSGTAGFIEFFFA